MVNLHRGLFTLGTARDDARRAASVLAETDADFLMVNCRLAPDPFPTGLEDDVAA